MADFWNSAALEPKRNFKFQLYIKGVPTYIIKVAGRPNFKVGETPHRYLGKEFWFPGTVSWEPVNVTLVDPIQINSVAIMRDIIVQSGYDWIKPNTPINANILSTISKKNAVEAMGLVHLVQIDSDGNTIDSWKLQNAWIASFTPTELSYDSDELSEVQLTLRYDWAIVETPSGTGLDNALGNLSPF